MGACPRRHLQSLPIRHSQGGLNLRGTCSTCPGGEDHLKRRSSSPPVPPLLGCRHCSRESISCHSGGKPWTSLCAGHLLDSLCKCRKRSNAGDARGEAPCMKITLLPPFPTGEGGWGDRGKENKLKAGGGGRQRRQAPLDFPQRQGEPVPRGFSPPLGTTVAGIASAARVQPPPCGHPISRDSRYRRGIKYGYPPTYYPYSA